MKYFSDEMQYWMYEMLKIIFVLCFVYIYNGIKGRKKLFVKGSYSNV